MQGGTLRIVSGGVITFAGGKFEGNNAGTNGGAIQTNSVTLTFNGTTFTGNTATGTGPAIHNNGGTTLTLNGCDMQPDGIYGNATVNE